MFKLKARKTLHTLMSLSSSLLLLFVNDKHNNVCKHRKDLEKMEFGSFFLWNPFSSLVYGKADENSSREITLG